MPDTVADPENCFLFRGTLDVSRRLGERQTNFVAQMTGRTHQVYPASANYRVCMESVIIYQWGLGGAPAANDFLDFHPHIFEKEKRQEDHTTQIYA